MFFGVGRIPIPPPPPSHDQEDLGGPQNACPGVKKVRRGVQVMDILACHLGVFLERKRNEFGGNFFIVSK